MSLFTCKPLNANRRTGVILASSTASLGGINAGMSHSGHPLLKAVILLIQLALLAGAVFFLSRSRCGTQEQPPR